MPEKTLLVVDLQPTFKVEPYYTKLLNFIEKNRDNYSKIIATRFVNNPDSIFVRKLGYKDCEKAEELDFKADYIIEKNAHYDIRSGTIKELLSNKNIDVMGADADACVLSTCFSLWNNDINFHILKDYIYSSGGDKYLEQAISIMSRNFGEAIFLEATK